MKKTIMFALAILSAGLIAQDIKLPAPQLTGGASLREALTKRCTTRKYTEKELSEQQLSDLFYAASGMNRKDEKKLTIPTARNVQDIVIYAATKKGIYRYYPGTHMLKQIKKGDYRIQFGVNKSMFSAASVVLIYTSDLKKYRFKSSAEEKKFYAGVHAGFAMQNVNLFCAAENLGTVVIGMYDKKNIVSQLKLGAQQPVLMAQLVGTK